MRKLKPVTPGELLREEFLGPMGLTQYRLAKEISVPAQRIGEIVAGKRAITADTDLRYDTEVAEETLAETIRKIKPWKGLRPRAVHPA
jgi:addiction module HigA family antidote